MLISACTQQGGVAHQEGPEATAGLAQAFGSLRLQQPAADAVALDELRDPFVSTASTPGASSRAERPALPAPARRRRSAAAATSAPVRSRALAVGDAVAYRISARHLGVPVTVVQRVVDRAGNRLIVDEQIDDGFVEPLALRLRVDVAADGSRRIASVARLHQGVQLPYGTAAYHDVMTLLRPPAEADGHLLAATDSEARRFEWGGVEAEIPAANGGEGYRSQVVAVATAADHTPFRVAAVDASEADYEAWERALDAPPAANRIAAASAEADYEIWDAESSIADAGARVALAAADADYEAWDAAGAPASLTRPLAVASADADYEVWEAEAAAEAAAALIAAASSEEAYESWDTESGMFGTIRLPDFVTESLPGKRAIATRDDSEDYAAEIEEE